MDTAVGLVEAYLRVNGYFTVTEYPVVEAGTSGEFRTATDLDVLAFRFPGAGRLVPFQDGKAGGSDGSASGPDPLLGGASNEADMLIGEVKEGRAELNSAARDPKVLRAVLSRFGCCSSEHIPAVVETLLRHGRARTPCGHVVRLVAFGSLPPAAAGHKYAAISLGHIHEFLQGFVREYWDALCHAQFKDRSFGFEVLLEKVRRASNASLT